MTYGIRGLYNQTANQSKNQESAPVRQLAKAGMKGDDTVGHLTTGEVVLPKSAQTPGLMALLAKQMRSKGLNPDQYVVGSPESNLNRNPITGAQQFYDDSGIGGDTAGRGENEGMGMSDSPGAGNEGGGPGSAEDYGYNPDTGWSSLDGWMDAVNAGVGISTDFGPSVGYDMTGPDNNWGMGNIFASPPSVKAPEAKSSYGPLAGFIDMLSIALPGGIVANGLSMGADGKSLGQKASDRLSGLFSDWGSFDTAAYDGGFEEGGNDGTGASSEEGKIDFAQLSPIEVAALLAPEVDITTPDSVQLTEAPTVNNTYGFGPGKYLYPWLVDGHTQYGPYPWKDIV